MATVFTVAAASTPPIITYSDVIDPSLLVSPYSQKLAQADVTELRTKINTNAVELDLAGRFGGGGYAVGIGLGLTINAGLSLTIAPGNAIIDGYTYYAGTNYALADNVYSWLWLTKTASLEVQTNATSTPPAPTANARAFLGRVLTAAGAITQIDGSGVLSILGGTLYRRTGDTIGPTDSPPANLIIMTRTVGGVYMWDGSAHRKFVNVKGVTDKDLDFSVWGRIFSMMGRG